MAADAEEFFLQCDPTSENLVAYVSIPYAFSDSACQLLGHERLFYLARRWIARMLVNVLLPSCAGKRRQYLVGSLTGRRGTARAA